MKCRQDLRLIDSEFLSSKASQSKPKLMNWRLKTRTRKTEVAAAEEKSQSKRRKKRVKAVAMRS